MAKSKGKYPKGYHSKEARYARKSAACEKCQAQAAKILEVQPRKPRKKREPVVREKGYYKKRAMDAVAALGLAPMVLEPKKPRKERVRKERPPKVPRVPMTEEAMNAYAKGFAARLHEKGVKRRTRKAMRMLGAPM